MKKLTLPIAALLVAGFTVSSANAQCAFDVPQKAKGIKASLIRAHAPCPSTEHPVSNTSTDAGTEACTPVTPKELGDTGVGTDYSFNEKGSCQAQTQAKLVKACEDLTDASKIGLGLEPGPCHVTFVKAKCKGIVQVDGTTPIAAGDDGWVLATLSRASLNDDSNGDMTVIDFPVSFSFDTPNNGSIKLKGNSAESLIPLVGVNNAELPTCTAIEVVDINVKDPTGRAFARMGGSTLP